MLHELLFALLGKTGTVVRADQNGMSIDRSLQLFNQQQMKLLNQIVKVGEYYGQLHQFIQKEIYQLFDYSSSNRREPSVYRQAVAAGLDPLVQQYTSFLQSIENEYLEHRHFTIGNLKAQLVKYQLIFPQLLSIIENINLKYLRGGAIVDYIYEKYQSGNNWLQQSLKPIINKCYEVLINQINAWIMYGEIVDKYGEFFVHRVTFEPLHKFKFNSKNVRQVDITDWEMYTLEVGMIPVCLLSQETAGKILFIGKSSKILRSCQKISILPNNQSIQRAKELKENSFENNKIEETIEKIRYNIAQKMIILIRSEQQFLKQLQKVNEYYLMCRGDFYHLLLQQSKGLEQIAHKQKALKKLNQLYLQNAFMRLGSFEDTKKINFQLRPLGFKLDGFRTFNHLCPVGNIDLIDGKAVRFNGSDVAIWHKSKQIVENDFHIGCLFRFRKFPKFFQNRQENSKNNVSKATLSLVIQNCNQVSPNSHANPHTHRFLEEFISIDFGFISNQKNTEYASFIKIVVVNQKNGGKPALLANTQLRKMNLHDEGLYHIKVSYRENASDKNLRVSIGLPNSGSSYEIGELSTDLSLPYYVNLEMGRANIGFISSILGPNYCAEVQQWEMICTAANHYGDHWSDICLNFKTAWPLDLVLTPDLLQHFSRVHKFLFPLRQTQIDLEQIWPRIHRRIKQEHCNNQIEKKQMKIFQRRFSALRSKMCLIVSQLWAYFQADVIANSWNKLKLALTQTDDFQNLIGMVNKYIKSIQTMLFFNVPKIQKSINIIIKLGKQFTHYFTKLEEEDINEEDFQHFEEIKGNFDEEFYKFVDTLKQLSNINSTHHLFYLTQRMTSCTFYEKSFKQY